MITTKQSNDENTLKASFCRQHFPYILQFLKHFCLSETINEKKEECSLNMDFLLQSYDHLNGTEENKKYRKQSCEWELEDVDKKDVLLAIDEYFYITGQNDLLKVQRDKLLYNILRSGKKMNYKFEDQTTFAILNHFNVVEFKESPKGIWDMGKQKMAFDAFVAYPSGIDVNFKHPQESDKIISGVIEEYPFVNSFHLLSSIRNWLGHNIANFLDDEFSLFHRFIIYAHIGIVYMCRRMWNKYSTELEKVCTIPSIIHDFNLLKDNVKVTIKGITKDMIISKCRYSIENGESHFVENDSNDEVSFRVEVEKYTPFIVCFECNGINYKIEKRIPYYGWDSLFIQIEPPANVHCHFEGIAENDNEIEKKISDLFSEFEKKYTNAEDKYFKTLTSFWDRMEPILQQQSEFMSKSLSESEEKLKELLRDEAKHMISESFNRNNDIVSGITRLSNNSRRTDEILKNIDERNKKIALTEFIKSHIIVLVLLVFSIVIFWFSQHNDFSIDFIRQTWWMILVEVLGVLSIGVSIWKIWEAHETASHPFVARPIFKIAGWGLVGLSILFLFFSFFMIPYKTPQGLIDNYDFSSSSNQDGDNAKVARIMEVYLSEEKPVNDERLRIQLSTYYLKYTGEIDKALSICEPMFKDRKKYSNGIWSYAEVLYEKKDFDGVWTILNDYNDNSSAAECLEGTLLVWGQGCTKDVHKGLRKLFDAFKNGSKEAQYQIGRFLINDMTDWNAPGNSIDIADMDIVKGMIFLQRIAWQRPQAALELGKLYSDLNMIDSALYYYSKAINMASDTLLLEAKYQMGLLAERNIDSLKHYMTEAKLAKYPPALIHSAITEKDHKRIIDIYEAAGNYNGYRFIPPIVIEYIATNQLEKALNTLREAHPKGLFDDEFVEGMAYILGSDYVQSDSIKGMELLKQSATNGCKFAQMIMLYTQLEEVLHKGNEITNAQLAELENYGKRDSISFAYVLEANLMNREGKYDKAYHAAMIALSLGNPAGAVELRDGFNINPKWREYQESLEGNIPKKQWYYRTKQIALRWIANRKAKERSITSGYVMDLSLHADDYPAWRLAFWSDVIMANHIFGLSFSPLEIWLTGDNNEQSDYYKRKLLISALTDLTSDRNKEHVISPNQRKLIIATLNNLADKRFRESLMQSYGKDTSLKEILESTDDQGYNPKERNDFEIADYVLSLNHVSIEGILKELSYVIGTDYYHLDFLNDD